MWYGKMKRRAPNPIGNGLIVEIKGNPKQLETLTSKGNYKTFTQYDSIKSIGYQRYCVKLNELKFTLKCIPLFMTYVLELNVY